MWLSKSRVITEREIRAGWVRNLHSLLPMQYLDAMAGPGDPRRVRSLALNWRSQDDPAHAVAKKGVMESHRIGGHFPIRFHPLADHR
jgi:hypothetical protein